MALAQPLTADPELDDLLAARPALTMHAQDGLCFEDVPLHAIADAHGTPCWVYGAGTLRARYRALAGALAEAGLKVHIHYAVKANDHLAILGLYQTLGAGADVVSLGEFMRAQQAGIAGGRCGVLRRRQIGAGAGGARSPPGSGRSMSRAPKSWR